MEQALALYEPMFGPFSTLDPGPMTYDYRGKQETCDMCLAFGRSGDVEIELIEWVSRACPHKEFLDASVTAAAEVGYASIWGKRYGEGLAVAYRVRGGRCEGDRFKSVP